MFILTFLLFLFTLLSVLPPPTFVQFFFALIAIFAIHGSDHSMHNNYAHTHTYGIRIHSTYHLFYAHIHASGILVPEAQRIRATENCNFFELIFFLLLLM